MRERNESTAITLAPFDRAPSSQLHLLLDRCNKIFLSAQHPVQTGRRNFQLIGAWHRVRCVDRELYLDILAVSVSVPGHKSVEEVLPVRSEPIVVEIEARDRRYT